STRLAPKRSPSQPDVGMNTARLTRKPITTVSTDSGREWKSRPIVGRATLMIVVSMIAMNMALTYTTGTAIFWFNGAPSRIRPDPYLHPSIRDGGAIRRSGGRRDVEQLDRTTDRRVRRSVREGHQTVVIGQTVDDLQCGGAARRQSGGEGVGQPQLGSDH